jgi:hypothetical protein
MSDQVEVASPVARLRPTPDEVNALAQRALSSSQRVLRKGGRINNIREVMIYASLAVSLGILAVSGLVDKDEFGNWKWVIVALSLALSGLNGLATYLTPQRAAQAFDTGNAWARLQEETLHALGGQLGNTAGLPDSDARRWFETLQKKRELLEDEEVDQLRTRAAQLPNWNEILGKAEG